MNKTKYLSAIAIFFLLLSETNIYADAIGVNPLVLSGALLLIILIIVGVLGLIAWLIIRSIRKRKNQV